VVAGWGDAPMPDEEIGLVAADPRLARLGWRAIVAADDVASLAPSEEGDADAYHAYRIGLGVPAGGKDFMWNDAFPHEAMMDQLRGVDFDKGCFVGQEVVSRIQHRGTARTRAVPVVYLDGFVAEAGADVTAGERTLGRVGPGAAGRALATIRLDRAADALAAGETLRAGGLPIRIEKPDWIGFPFPGEVESATRTA
jgi:folate-binding protein YgfZ